MKLDWESLVLKIREEERRGKRKPGGHVRRLRLIKKFREDRAKKKSHHPEEDS